MSVWMVSVSMRNRGKGVKEDIIWGSRKGQPIEKAILPPLEFGNGIALKVDHDYVLAIQQNSWAESN